MSSASTPLSESIANSMIETSRRQRATVTGGESTLDDDSGYTREFQTEDQKVMLWNVANTHLHPRSLFPAFRLLGLFADTETALAHGEMVVATDPRCSLRLVATHAWYTLPTHDTPTDEAVDKVNRNLLHHQAMLQDHATEFQKRHDSLTAGRTPALRQAQDAQDASVRAATQRTRRRAIYEAALVGDETALVALQAKFEVEMKECAEAELVAQLRAQLKEEEERGRASAGVAESKGAEEEYTEPVLAVPIAPEVMNEKWEEKVSVEGGGRMPAAVSRMVEVRNQRYAVVSVVTDYETAAPTNPLGAEPGVIVWAAFDTEAEALRYNKCVASKKVRDHDLAVVSMYEWLYPHMMSSDRVDQLYRNEELNNIMRHARNTSTHVREFEDMCGREEIEVPTLSVEPDLVEAAPRTWVPPPGSSLNDQSLVK